MQEVGGRVREDRQARPLVEACPDDEGQLHGLILAPCVRARRQALKLTLEQVAERMGEEGDAGWVQAVETGRRKRLPAQPKLGALARALRWSEEEILRQAGVLTTAPGEKSREMELFDESDPRAEIIRALPDLTDLQATHVREFIGWLTEAARR